MVERRRIDTISSIFVIGLTPIFFIALSAFIVCIFRPLYYVFINPLKIPQESGYSYSVIVEAYNDIMNFIWRGTTFKAGSLEYTAEAKAHFVDCRHLFQLQAVLAIISGTILSMYIVLTRKKILIKRCFKGLSPFTYGGIISIGLLLIIGVFALINFDALFTVFHYIAFPGKGNWIFDEDTEPLIDIFPESFFGVCALFIILIVTILSIIVIVIGFKNRKRILKEHRHELRNSISDK